MPGALHFAIFAKFGFCGAIALRFRYPHPSVTSNLASHPKSVHHGRGERSTVKSHDNGPNPFVVKILTSKPSAIKILHALFASPAPSKPFQWVGGGGIPLKTM